MSVLSFEDFGVADLNLYRAYVACNAALCVPSGGQRERVLHHVIAGGVLPFGATGSDDDVIRKVADRGVFGLLCDDVGVRGTGGSVLTDGREVDGVVGATVEARADVAGAGANSAIRDGECVSGSGCASEPRLVSTGYVSQRCGPNRERNVQWRRNKQERKRLRQQSGVDWRRRDQVGAKAESVVGTSTLVREAHEAVALSFSKVCLAENEKKLLDVSAKDDGLRLSLRRKWQAQNELAAAEAERKLKVLAMIDVSEEAKRKSIALRAGIERDMVSIERTHATLSASGNVPEVFHGSAETEVSSAPGLSEGVKSGTISPNSSVSEAEVRAMQKQILDMELALTRYRQATGISLEALEKKDKCVWTDTSENHAILEELYPMGYGIDTFGFPEGKFRPT